MPTHLSRESTFSLFSGPSKVFHSLSALTAQKLAVSLDAQLRRDRKIIDLWCLRARGPERTEAHCPIGFGKCLVHFFDENVLQSINLLFLFYLRLGAGYFYGRSSSIQSGLDWFQKVQHGII